MNHQDGKTMSQEYPSQLGGPKGPADLRFHLASCSIKMGPLMALKKVPSTCKPNPVDLFGGSKRGRLACAFLEREATARTQISQNAARAHLQCSKVLFEGVSIANVPNNCLQAYRNGRCQQHTTLRSTNEVSVFPHPPATPPGPGPRAR